MTLTINLPDDQAAALKAKAAAEGLSLEDWFKSLAADLPAAPGTLQTAADIVLEEMRKVPPEVMAALSKDGASEHNHYPFGWPKEEASSPSLRTHALALKPLLLPSSKAASG